MVTLRHPADLVAAPKLLTALQGWALYTCLLPVQETEQQTKFIGQSLGQPSLKLTANFAPENGCFKRVV